MPHTHNGITAPLVVDRHKNPGRLLLIHGDNTYEDKVAQAIIDDMFGNYEIWLISCYIGQGCRNNFLTAPNKGKMELLNSIAFHEEDPSTFIERIDAVSAEAGKEYTAKLAVYNKNLELFQAMVAGVDTTKALAPPATATLTTTMQQYSDDRTRLQAVKSQRDVDLGVLRNLNSQLESANGTVIAVTSPSPQLLALSQKFGGESLDTFEHIDATVQRIGSSIPVLQQRDQLRSNVDVLTSQLLPYINATDFTPYTQEDYQEAIAQEVKLRDSQRAASMLNVLYSANAIAETIASHQQVLAAQERLKAEQQRDNLQAQVTGLELLTQQPHSAAPVPSIVPQDIPMPDYSKYGTDAHVERVNALQARKGELTAHIQHLRQGQGVLQCPQCAAPIRYQDNRLILADTAPLNEAALQQAHNELTAVTTEITELQTTIQQIGAAAEMARRQYDTALVGEQRRIAALKEQQRVLELEQQRREIEAQNRAQQLANLKLQLETAQRTVAALPQAGSQQRRILSPAEIQSTHATIAQLSSLVITSAPTVPSQRIKVALDHQALLRQKAEVEKKYQDFLVTVPEPLRAESIANLQMWMQSLRSHWAAIKNTSEERIRVERLRQSLTEQIQTTLGRIPPDPSPSIEALATAIADIQTQLALSTRAHTVLAEHAKVTTERGVVIALNTEMANLQTLRQSAVDAECLILQQVVDSINASIEGVCGTLFDRDISIALNLFKTAKTTHNVKPLVNFEIAYQGGTFDNITQMSGGEGDRASLALTLALNRLSTCPFIMLDESLSSLDTDMKEAAVRTIREHTNNTVLIILHDGVEGIFDHIIDMDTHKQASPPVDTAYRAHINT
jgi:DNA repair exonuclease SbcCD ATPase subunit